MINNNYWAYLRGRAYGDNSGTITTTSGNTYDLVNQWDNMLIYNISQFAKLVVSKDDTVSEDSYGLSFNFSLNYTNQTCNIIINDGHIYAKFTCTVTSSGTTYTNMNRLVLLCESGDISSQKAVLAKIAVDNFTVDTTPKTFEYIIQIK